MNDRIKQLQDQLVAARQTPPPQINGETDAAYATRLQKIIDGLPTVEAEAGEHAEDAEAGVPIYESHSSKHMLTVTEWNPETKQRDTRPSLQFAGAHRGFGAIRLDAATLDATWPDDSMVLTAEEQKGKSAEDMRKLALDRKRAKAVAIIEGSQEYKDGLKPGRAGQPGAIWKQSALAVVKTGAVMTQIRVLVSLYSQEDCRVELKRRQLSIPQKSEKETDAAYLQRLQDLVYNDMSGGAVAAPGNAGVTQLSRGTAVRGAGPN